MLKMNPASALAGSVFDAALALVYPQACAVCGQSVERRAHGVACEECWNATRVFTSTDAVCWKCGALVQVSVAEEKRGRVRCRVCDEDAYSAARAVGSYEGALRATVLSLKRTPHIASHVAQLLLQAQRCEPINRATMIIPVPLHFQRVSERGFNQAAVLARSLSLLTELPCDEDSVTRRINTALHRGGMDARARRESVAGAFAVRRSEAVRDHSVLLIDDVFTTGATASACSAALLDAGAAEVFVITLARA